MARSLRAPKSGSEVDRHHMHLSINFADDAAAEPGAPYVSVGIADEARKTKGRDAEGNDLYRNLSVKPDAALLNMKFGDALEYLMLEALKADEDRAAEVSP
jgi:hypothetical protein